MTTEEPRREPPEGATKVTRDCYADCQAAYDAAPKGSIAEQAAANTALRNCLAKC